MADADSDARPVDQDTLVADIDRTRAELARTIDAISDRVNPKKNVDRAMEQVRERAGQIDPLMAGAAAAAAVVVVGVTVHVPLAPPQALAAAGGRPQPALLVSSSYSAADSRSGGRAASPSPPVATRTRNIQPAV